MDQRQWFRLIAPAIALLIVAGAFLVSPLAISAQDGAPEVLDEPVFDRLYPVAIHAGTCTEGVDEVVHDLGFTDLLGAEDDTGLGTVPGPSVMAIDETIGATLEDLLDANHAIIVHGPDDFDEWVACGDFGGFVEGGKMGVTLVSVNESGINGVAILDEDQGALFGLLDTEIKVTVYLVKYLNIAR